MEIDINNEDKMHINSQDIIKLFLQYCKENNLNKTFQTLQNETMIKLNSLDSIDIFKNDIIKGKWDIVLKNINYLDIPANHLIELYEEIIYDLLENEEFEVAKYFLNINNTNSLYTNKYLKHYFPDRYEKLEILTNESIDVINKHLTELNKIKERRRILLAEKLSTNISIVAPGRLTYLLSLALKNILKEDNIPFTKYDFFSGKTDKIMMNDNNTESSFIENIYKTIKFDNNSYVEVAKFSPDGNYLATGSIDGFIEIWDPNTAKLKAELTYQFEDVIMYHKEGGITALNFSKDSKMIASGDNNGNMKVFKVQNGKCLREFPNAHSKGITALIFSKDSSLIISGSFDGLIHINGLKAGKLIKELHGHTSFINDLQIDWEDKNEHFYSASSDGTVKLWDLKHQELITTITPPVDVHILEISINNILLSKTISNAIFVSNRSNSIFLINNDSQVIKQFSTEKNKHIIGSAISHDGEWLYCVDEENELIVFSVKNNIIRKRMKIHEKDVINIIHHPHMSMLATYALDGVLNIYT